MNGLQNFRKQYPNLLFEARSFFDLQNMIKQGNTSSARKVIDFLSHYHENHSSSPDFPQPHHVNRLLQKLCEYGMMTFFGGRTGKDEENCYVCLKEGTLSEEEVGRRLNCVAFGMPCVYDEYSPSIIPLESKNASGDIQIGTSIVISSNCLLTARHCVDRAFGIGIRGISPDEFANVRIYVSTDEAIDLALLKFSRPCFDNLPKIFFGEGSILQEVMVLGYPKMPGFAAHLAAERATVSSRLEVTKGTVAANPFDIFSKQELLLISAKVRGGFSGGPVLNTIGECVGMVSRSPTSQAGTTADDIGYGVAIPTTLINQFISATNKIPNETISILDNSKFEFRAFSENK